MDIRERIIQYIEYKGISKYKFYQDTGFSNGFLDKKGSVGSEKCEIISDYYSDLDLVWLITGRGNMLKLDEKGIIQGNTGGKNNTNIAGNNNFLGGKLRGVELPERRDQQIPIKSYPKPQKIDNGIPLVDISAAAGFGTLEFAIEEKNVIARYVIPDFKGADMMMPIVGDSMEPKYTAGDIVACKILNDNKYIQWGKVYIVATKTQGFMLKRLYCSNAEECLECKSYNPEYPPFLIEKNDITGIAIVVGSIHLESLM